ncbi:hypothetical protein [Sorangium sp. So ce542]|uniref:hypothetical protein n=1 Tax=Sorangium sp. So ce542 TaxID=3133316 RepID=UPI003F6311B1
MDGIDTLSSSKSVFNPYFPVTAHGQTQRSVTPSVLRSPSFPRLQALFGSPPEAAVDEGAPRSSRSGALVPAA